MTDATSIGEAGCQQFPTACKGRRRDASVDCLVRPSKFFFKSDQRPSHLLVDCDTPNNIGFNYAIRL